MNKLDTAITLKAINATTTDSIQFTITLEAFSIRKDLEGSFSLLDGTVKLSLSSDEKRILRGLGKSYEARTIQNYLELNGEVHEYAQSLLG